eukprot:IDg14312t1
MLATRNPLRRPGSDGANRVRRDLLKDPDPLLDPRTAAISASTSSKSRSPTLELARRVAKFQRRASDGSSCTNSFNLASVQMKRTERRNIKDGIAETARAMETFDRAKVRKLKMNWRNEHSSWARVVCLALVVFRI